MRCDTVWNPIGHPGYPHCATKQALMPIPQRRIADGLAAKIKTWVG